MEPARPKGHVTPLREDLLPSRHHAFDVDRIGEDTRLDSSWWEDAPARVAAGIVDFLRHRAKPDGRDADGLVLKHCAVSH